MSDSSVPKVVVDEKVEVGVSLIGGLLAVAAAYYAGRTGDPNLLFAATAVLLLTILFVTAE